jgi:diguanylate cyclase (GGDEF)-like protein
MAHFDALTGLPNRLLFADRLAAGAGCRRRGVIRPLAVAYLDLDGFKAINDRFGHDTWATLADALAQRMKQACAKAIPGPHGWRRVCRQCSVDLTDAQASVPSAARASAACGTAGGVVNGSVQVSASLGVTFYPQPQAVDADQLLRQADQAMYQAKLAGKNRYHVFDADQDRHLRGHHESLERIRLALEQGEFVLHYQPKVNMRTGRWSLVPRP